MDEEIEALVVPDGLFSEEEHKKGVPDLFFYPYKVNQESTKNRIIFKRNIFSFIISGHKTIHTLDRVFHVDDSSCMLIRSGNCLTSERFARGSCFDSLTLYFDSLFLKDFLVRYSGYVSQFKEVVNGESEGVFVFEKDSFVEGFIASVQCLMASPCGIGNELTKIKLEELLLFLLKKYGAFFLNFINGFETDLQEVDFRVKMEAEVLNKLSLEEMAFLCNMSLSSFKRKFARVFGMSPQKWFQKKRLEFAFRALKRGSATPSDLYLELGYASLSSFSVAFSKAFGVSPAKV